jgi:hypothetical protein
MLHRIGRDFDEDWYGSFGRERVLAIHSPECSKSDEVGKGAYI